jgi:aminoglycoside phosphotransferase (APT) family kinase protein
MAKSQEGDLEQRRFEALTLIVAQMAGLTPSAVRIARRPALDHQSNHLYDARTDSRHWIVKEYLKADELLDAPRREFDALQLLAPFDIAPRPIAFQPAAPPVGPVVIYEFLEGEMWDRRRPTAEQLTQLAEVWLKMNSVPVEGLWPSRGFAQPLAEIALRFRADLQTYAGWAESEFKPAKRAAALLLSELERRRPALAELDDARPAFCFCRADPRFANVIQRPGGRLGLVDWEDSGLRDPAIDLADVVTHPNQEDLLTSEEWQHFLQPYLAARGGGDPGLGRRRRLYLALLQMYYSAVIIRRALNQIHSGQPGLEKVNNIPINLRLRRYLARALAWPAEDFSAQLATVQDMEFFPL